MSPRCYTPQWAGNLRNPQVPGRPSPLDREGREGLRTTANPPRPCSLAFAPFVPVRAARGPDGWACAAMLDFGLPNQNPTSATGATAEWWAETAVAGAGVGQGEGATVGAGAAGRGGRDLPVAPGLEGGAGVGVVAADHGDAEGGEAAELVEIEAEGRGGVGERERERAEPRAGIAHGDTAVGGRAAHAIQLLSVGGAGCAPLGPPSGTSLDKGRRSCMCYVIDCAV